MSIGLVGMNERDKKQFSKIRNRRKTYRATGGPVDPQGKQQAGAERAKKRNFIPVKSEH
jgi:hypothetical protein